MDHHKFTSLRAGAGPGDYFAIRDTLHQEYVNGKPFTTSRVDWQSGNRVNLIFAWLTEELRGQLFALGDTVKLEIVSFNKDTLSLRADFKDYPTSSVFKYLRSALEK